MSCVPGCDSNDDVENAAGTIPTTTRAPEARIGGKAPDLEKSRSQKRKESQDNQHIAEDLGVRLRNARFKGYDIGIEFKNGTVKLTGSVSSAKEIERASAIVKENKYVETVINQLKVDSRAE